MSLLDRLVLQGDCVAVMAMMAENSVDAIVTDPPYGIGFMGKAWDGAAIAAAAAKDRETRKSLGPESDSRPGRAQARSSSAFGNEAIIAGPVSGGRDFQAWCELWAREALRILKPGGHLLTFGGTRTYHRVACAVEDAGFEIRDSVIWLYGSGFPKSMNVGKAIDKAAGAERKVVGVGHAGASSLERVRRVEQGYRANLTDVTPEAYPITASATAEAQRWEGWGTALKPAHEPVVVARKPLEKRSVASNVVAYGTGAINIDGCRVGFVSTADELESKQKNRHADFDSGPRENAVFGEDKRARGENGNYDASGRWPANVILDSAAAEKLDEQTGVSASRIGKPRRGVNGDGWGMTSTGAEYDDKGGASRFFYCAKAAPKERNAGLEDRNSHPTVKPLTLMRYLVRLVTPPDGLVLDPFCGSGTTGIAALQEGFRFVGIEREDGYCKIARARIEHAAQELSNKEQVAA